jgi:WD40 repeat protein
MIWNCALGTKLVETDTGNQVSGIHWNQHYKEVITGHGHPNNVLKIWKYPKFNHVAVSFIFHMKNIEKCPPKNKKFSFVNQTKKTFRRLVLGLQ